MMAIEGGKEEWVLKHFGEENIRMRITKAITLNFIFKCIRKDIVVWLFV